MMVIDKEIYTIAKRINDIAEDTEEVLLLTNSFLEKYKKYSYYQRQCIIAYIVDKIVEDDAFVVKKLALKEPFEIKNISKFISDNYNDFYFDFKDIGQYVKYDNDIFQVQKRDKHTITNANGDVLDIDYCEVSSIQELRKQKIQKILKNEKGLD